MSPYLRSLVAKATVDGGEVEFSSKFCVAPLSELSVDNDGVTYSDAFPVLTSPIIPIDADINGMRVWDKADACPEYENRYIHGMDYKNYNFLFRTSDQWEFNKVNDIYLIYNVSYTGEYPDDICKHKRVTISVPTSGYPRNPTQSELQRWKISGQVKAPGFKFKVGYPSIVYIGVNYKAWSDDGKSMSSLLANDGWKLQNCMHMWQKPYPYHNSIFSKSFSSGTIEIPPNLSSIVPHIAFVKLISPYIRKLTAWDIKNKSTSSELVDYAYNTNILKWDVIGNDKWGTIKYIGIFDAIEDGNLLYWTRILKENPVNGSQYVINQGDIKIRLWSAYSKSLRRLLLQDTLSAAPGYKLATGMPVISEFALIDYNNMDDTFSLSSGYQSIGALTRIDDNDNKGREIYTNSQQFTFTSNSDYNSIGLFGQNVTTIVVLPPTLLGSELKHHSPYLDFIEDDNFIASTYNKYVDADTTYQEVGIWSVTQPQSEPYTKLKIYDTYKITSITASDTMLAVASEVGGERITDPTGRDICDMNSVWGNVVIWNTSAFSLDSSSAYQDRGAEYYILHERDLTPNDIIDKFDADSTAVNNLFPVRSMDFTSDGSMLMIASGPVSSLCCRGYVGIWDVNNKSMLQSVLVHGVGAKLWVENDGTEISDQYTDYPTTVACSGNGLFATGSYRGRIKIWVKNAGDYWVWYTTLAYPYVGLTSGQGTLHCLAWSPEGNILASVCDKYGAGVRRSIKLWEYRYGQICGWNPIEFDNDGKRRWANTYSISFSPDGKYMASSHDYTIKIWDVSVLSRFWPYEGYYVRMPNGQFPSTIRPDLRASEFLQYYSDLMSIESKGYYEDLAQGNEILEPMPLVAEFPHDAVNRSAWEPRNNAIYSSDGNYLAAAYGDNSGGNYTLSVWPIQTNTNADQLMYVLPTSSGDADLTQKLLPGAIEFIID